MNTKKTLFTLSLLFFLALMVLFSLMFNPSYYSKAPWEKQKQYQMTNYTSCQINLVEPTIILRMDDVRAYSYPVAPLVDEVLKRDLSITLGIIPRDLEKDQKMLKYLNEIKDNPNIEIAQHGTTHSEADITITQESLFEGNQKIKTLLSTTPVTYITPYNQISNSSKEMVSNYFRVISSQENILKEGKNAVEIGYTVGTYKYIDNEITNLDEIISKCKDSLEKTNVCVIMIHPQEYSMYISNAKNLSNNKFENFKTMLNELENLNAEFKTFNEITHCN
jgi:hypothetical protein